MLLHEKANQADQNNLSRKSIWVSSPLSMKQAAKIIFAQSKHRTIQSIIAREKYLLERGAF